MAIEQTGLVPRSISRTLERFFNELVPTSEEQVIREFRVSRSQALTSFYYFLRLLTIPCFIWVLIFQTTIKPFHDFIVFKENNITHTPLQHLILEKCSQIEDRFYFDFLRNKTDIKSIDFELIEGNFNSFKEDEQSLIKNIYNEKAAGQVNLFCLFISLTIFFLLTKIDKSRLSILRSFLDESLYGLNDATKAFLLILITDIFVGFHSPKGWEIFLDQLLDKLGIIDTNQIVIIFVASFPVLLDTIFKYWIFRYLNRLSPSAVATYHNINE